jgi:hypothetical protein
VSDALLYGKMAGVLQLLGFIIDCPDPMKLAGDQVSLA